MKKYILLILAFFIIAGCSSEGPKKANYNPNPKAGDEATDFLFKDMAGKPFRLSEHRGEVVMLYFWRMKCPECMEEMKSLDLLAKKYRDKGLIVVTVGADNMHSAALGKVISFLEDNGYDAWVTLRDDQGFVSEAYDVLIAPETFVIDKKGVIAAVQKGKADWMGAEKLKLIESLLNG